jgi:hypothetical protein
MHGCHGIRSGSITFLDAVDMFAGFGEDVWIFGGREDSVEVCLVKAFADLENGVGSS